MMIENQMAERWLSRNESRIYMALLKLGMSTAKPIIEKTGMHRQIVYNTLDSLIKKGLASYVIQNNRKHFLASDPHQIMKFFDEKEDEIKQEKESFGKIITELCKIRDQHKESQEAVLYKGNKGIRSILDDVIREGKEIFIIGASDSEAEALQYNIKYTFPGFYRDKEKKKISAKIIYSIDMRERAKDLSRMKYTEARVLPREFTSNSGIMIYGSKTAIIFWGAEPFGVVISSSDIAESNRKHFSILWKISKEP